MPSEGYPGQPPGRGVWGHTAPGTAMPQNTRHAARACWQLAPHQPLARPVLPASLGHVPRAVGGCEDSRDHGMRLRPSRRSSRGCQGGAGEPWGGRLPRGAGSLEGPSVKERKLEENKWLEQEPGERQPQPSHSPWLCHRLIPASGHQQPRPAAPLELATMAGAVAGMDRTLSLVHPRLPHSPLAVPATSLRPPAAEPCAGPRQPCALAASGAGAGRGPACGTQGPQPAALGCCSCRASFRHGRPVSSRLPLPGRQPAAADT